MATWHKDKDPLLNMDIPSLASTVSKKVISASHKDNLTDVMREAVTATHRPRVVGGSRIATLIVPHDMSWEIHPPSVFNNNNNGDTSGTSSSSSPLLSLPGAAVQFIQDCGAAMKQCQGKKAIYIGGRGGLSGNGALEYIGKIAAATGADIYSENAFARLDRGRGLPDVSRLPYFPKDAVAALAKYELLVLVDVRRPVANFGYEGGPSVIITERGEDSIWEIDSTEVDVPAALRALCSAVGGDAIVPFKNCRGTFISPSTPPPSLPTGRLNPTSMCQIVAALQPEGAIVVDESLTSGNAYWESSRGCPPFSHMCLTGGAIGCGPPLAVGAAVACPDRQVINLQADGSAMYSLQALWTQAREGLNVITIICANHTYAILKVEMAKQRITPASGKAARALTELGQPRIDWVALAGGMGVVASRVKTAQEFEEQLKVALKKKDGPSLIEACL
jgi:acetolactate synthase-1/2/3 large subunit